MRVRKKYALFSSLFLFFGLYTMGTMKINAAETTPQSDTTETQPINDHSQSDDIADGTYQIVSSNEKYVVDVPSASQENGKDVQLFTNNNTDAQGWKVSHDENGYVTFTNVSSGKALDVSGGSKQSGTTVQQYTSNQTNAQKWTIKKSENGYKIISALDSQLALDVSGAAYKNGSKIQVSILKDLLSQQWNFIPYLSQRARLDILAQENEKTLADGIYTIRSAKNANYVVDVIGKSTKNGGNVQLFQSNSTDAQGWIITHGKDKYVTIRNVASNKVLDVAGAITKNGTNLQQFTDNGTYAQKWIIVKSAKGYSILSALDTHFCLDLSGGIVTNSRNIQLFQVNNSDAQQWTFSAYVIEQVRMNNALDQLAQAHRNTIADGVYQIANASHIGYSLDVVSDSKSNSARIFINSINNVNPLGWQIKNDSQSGYVTIKNMNSNKLLDVRSAQTANHTVVQQFDSNGTRAQKWIIIKVSNGYKIVSGLNSNMVLDIPSNEYKKGKGIHLFTFNNSGAQKWSFISSANRSQQMDALASDNKAVIKDGVYEIVNKNVSKVIDVSSASKNNGANIQVYAVNSTNAQRWNVTHDSKGYVIFKNVNSNKVLDITAANKKTGTNIQQYADNGSGAQKWIVLQSGNGYEISSALGPNIHLNLSGTNVQTGTDESAMWKFQAPTVKKDTYVWNGPKLTAASGVNYGPSGKETYYNLDMSGVISIMRSIGNQDAYWVRNDGVKMLGDYVMIAADLSLRPRGSHVPTSLGMGVVCDTGFFAYSNSTQIDIAVTW